MAVPHPYTTAPDCAFWSRAVAAAWSPAGLLDPHEFLIRKDDKVVSAGSCFASNLISYLEGAGLTYLRTEEAHPLFYDLEPENLGYAKFSAAYGNIYTARQLLQLLKRCLKLFAPIEDRWAIGDDIIDTLRPGLRYRARSDREFELLTAQHLRKTSEAFEGADVFVCTLGLTEAWVSRLDGTVFPACPGTVAGAFDPERHEFRNFTVAEIVGDLDEFLGLLRGINPGVRVIITVSPVPLVATATGGHVLSATTYSKSVLRVAAEEIAKRHDRVTYFPAYEIVTGPQAPADFFEADRRSVSRAGVEAVMSALLAHCEVATMAEAKSRIATQTGQAPGSGNGSVASEISRLIIARECEEAMADSRLPPPDAPPLPNGLDALGGAPQRNAENERLEVEVRSLRAELSALQSMLSEERAARQEEANRAIAERDALAGEARRWFEAVLAITPDHHPRSQVRRRRRAWWREVARRLGGEAIRLSPIVLAARASDARKWELAVRYCRDALDLEPNESALWVQCAGALRAAGKFAEAELAYRQAYEIEMQRAQAAKPRRHLQPSAEAGGAALIGTIGAFAAGTTEIAHGPADG